MGTVIRRPDMSLVKIFRVGDGHLRQITTGPLTLDHPHNATVDTLSCPRTVADHVRCLEIDKVGHGNHGVNTNFHFKGTLSHHPNLTPVLTTVRKAYPRGWLVNR